MTNDILLNGGRLTRGTNGFGLMSGCCCKSNCGLVYAGTDDAIHEDWFHEGHEVPMCVSASVRDWVYIYSWDTWVDYFRTETGTYGFACGGPVPPYPVYRPSGATPIGTWPGISYRMKQPSSDNVSPFPLSDLDEDEIAEGLDPCWNLYNFNGFRAFDTGQIQLWAGTVEREDCNGVKRTFQLGLTAGKVAMEDCILSYIADEPVEAFGRIIREGQYIGWFENPLYVRMAMISKHTRWRRGYFNSDPKGPARPPPAWPDKWLESDPESASRYTSVAQKIEWYIIGRFETVV